MKKTILSTAAALTMFLTLTAAGTAAADKAEISFKVGDSSLTVNGEAIEVAAPYVVGEGTTLVPVRVITEAFGAEVSWDGDTQTVGLHYPDVEISLQIGSKAAMVNNHSEALSDAPELFEGTTMVPLRFISETFGAVVTYEDKTKLITVTKAGDAENAENEPKLAGTTDMEYIGDSYYGWTMKNPKGMMITEQNFDCTAITFSDGANQILVGIDIMDEENDVDTEFNSIKQQLSSGTISVADRVSIGNGITKIHFRSKDKSNSYDVYEFVKGEYFYYTFTVVDAETDAETQNEIFEIAESLSITDKREFYDLTNVADDKRAFSDETYRIKAALPAKWKQHDLESENLFSFYDPDNHNCGMTVGIYSKSDTTTAELLAKKDRETYESITNPSLVTVSEITKGTLNGREMVYYTAENKGTGDNAYTLKDCFFEIGEYVYNVSVQGKSAETEDAVLSSFEAEELDASEIGTVLRSSDLGGNNKLTVPNGKVTVSNTWTQITPSSIVEARTGAAVLMFTDTNPNNGTAKSAVLQLTDGLVQEQKGEFVGDVKSFIVSANNNGYYQTISYQVDDNTVYTTLYAFKSGKSIYCFLYNRYDIYYGGSLDKEVLKMAAEFEL